jgi:hypothetical protein
MSAYSSIAARTNEIASMTSTPFSRAGDFGQSRGYLSARECTFTLRSRSH